MIAWRISKAKRAGDLSGIGAAREGGRWNDVDVPAVYMGMTPAICCLETFVHATGVPKFPLKITRFILPDDEALFFEPEPGTLPTGWESVPSDRPSMNFGTRWLKSQSHLGLIVPSAVLPLERNVVLNPAHPAIEDVKIDTHFEFMYDKRMFASQ
ncbi:RES family NAD+ phosphorylase [Alcaligenes faecalis]|uniref:RES family NAD+ phosphorylase n=1 Tax=Alcaligenes faecalis TaxID=511 RepID=UPI0024BBF5A4|nr:RES family NAD+ phosphorylase [Alcaligenes faecalis]WHQ45909.1 RES domain-containing protein [Alcaligenes faecalis]